MLSPLCLLLSYITMILSLSLLVIPSLLGSLSIYFSSPSFLLRCLSFTCTTCTTHSASLPPCLSFLFFSSFHLTSASMASVTGERATHKYSRMYIGRKGKTAASTHWRMLHNRKEQEEENIQGLCCVAWCRMGWIVGEERQVKVKGKEEESWKGRGSFFTSRQTHL